MSNPYEAPQGDYPPVYTGMPVGAGGGNLGDSGMVRQVSVVCILMFVQAGLELLYGVFALFMGPLMSKFFQNMQQGARNQPPPAQMAQVADVVSTVYTVIGLLLISVAIFRILTGVLNIKYRARGLGIASFIVGLLTMFTAYCAITTIGLSVYGLIVYLNQDTKRAFALGSRGYTKDQILAAPRFE